MLFLFHFSHMASEPVPKNGKAPWPTSPLSKIEKDEDHRKKQPEKDEDLPLKVLSETQEKPMMEKGMISITMLKIETL